MKLLPTRLADLLGGLVKRYLRLFVSQLAGSRLVYQVKGRIRRRSDFLIITHKAAPLVKKRRKVH